MKSSTLGSSSKTGYYERNRRKICQKEHSRQEDNKDNGKGCDIDEKARQINAESSGSQAGKNHQGRTETGIENDDIKREDDCHTC